MSMFQGPTIVTGMPLSDKNRLHVIRILGAGESAQAKEEARKTARRNRRNYLARKLADQRRTAAGRWAK